MIEKVDAALASMLQRETQRLGWGTAVEVLFERAADPEAPRPAQIILQLATIVEDTSRRAEPYHYQRRPQDGMGVRQHTPIYLNLHYVVEVRAFQPELAHALTSHVLAAFLLNPTLPFRGGESDATALLSIVQPPAAHAPALTTALVGRATGPLLNLTVSVPFQPFSAEPVPLVREALMALGQRTPGGGISQPTGVRAVRVGATGTVRRENDGRPIAGAIVRATKDGSQTATDEEGRWVMLNLEPGEWELEISAAGFATAKTRAMAPAQGRIQDLRDVDVELAPLDGDGLIEEGRGALVRVDPLPPQRAGRLVYGDGRPASYVPIRSRTSSTVTTADGVYLLHADDREPLTAEIPGHGLVTIANGPVPSPQEARVRETTLGETIQQI